MKNEPEVEVRIGEDARKTVIGLLKSWHRAMTVEPLVMRRQDYIDAREATTLDSIRIHDDSAIICHPPMGRVHLTSGQIVTGRVRFFQGWLEVRDDFKYPVCCLVFPPASVLRVEILEERPPSDSVGEEP